VRGTLSNPKTQEAIKSDKPTPSLGDHGSLSSEASSKLSGDKTAQDSGTVNQKQANSKQLLDGKSGNDKKGEKEKVNESHLKTSESKL